MFEFDWPPLANILIIAIIMIIMKMNTIKATIAIIIAFSDGLGITPTSADTKVVPLHVG